MSAVFKLAGGHHGEGGRRPARQAGEGRGSGPGYTLIRKGAAMSRASMGNRLSNISFTRCTRACRISGLLRDASREADRIQGVSGYIGKAPSFCSEARELDLRARAFTVRVRVCLGANTPACMHLC